MQISWILYPIVNFDRSVAARSSAPRAHRAAICDQSSPISECTPGKWSFSTLPTQFARLIASLRRCAALSNGLNGKSAREAPGRHPINAVERKTPPFSAKEVSLFLLWVAIIALAVVAIVLMIWHAPGHDRIQPQPKGASVVSLTAQANA
jgi:hypothetical protein